MAEEKKKKIDLKGRLQKMGVAAPAGAGSSPAMIPAPGKSVPAPMPSVPPPAIPMPPGLSLPPTSLDPNNPLAAAAGLRPPAPPSQPAAPTRIEVDEGAVHSARAKAIRFMLVPVVGAAIVVGFIGYVTGGMKEASGAREKSATDAAALAADVGKAKDQLIQIVDVLDKGRKPLKNKQFPKELAKELSDIAVDFDGSKLAGRRFSSVSADTTRELFDFISGVEAVKAKKTLVQNLLGRTQKPLEENFALPKDTKPTEWAVVIDMGSAGGVALAKLVPPFIPTKEKPNLPEKLTLEKSKGNNVEVPRWTEKIPEKGPVAAIVQNPASMCESQVDKDYRQVRADLASLRNEIQREQSSSEEEGVADQKQDLVQKAEKLMAGLTAK